MIKFTTVFPPLLIKIEASNQNIQLIRHVHQFIGLGLGRIGQLRQMKTGAMNQANALVSVYTSHRTPARISAKNSAPLYYWLSSE